MIPKPFSRVRVSWQDPIALPGALPAPEATSMLQAALDRAVQRAEGRWAT